MVRYIGPKNKVARRFRKNLFGKPFEKKYKEGRTKLFHKRSSRQTEYGSLLKTRREVLIHYGISEKQLKRKVDIITKKRVDPKAALIALLEMSLANVVYRLGFKKTRGACRQLVSHSHVTVNGKVINIASYKVSENDIISIRDRDIENQNICDFSGCDLEVFKWLTFDKEKKQGKVIGIPTEEDVPEKKKWTDIIEIYSK